MLPFFANPLHRLRNPLRVVAGAVVAVLLLTNFGPARAESSAGIVAVLELFTSQGCSSCPKADALLKTYVDRQDVIALTMPVDYWDYLGWKDTFANPVYSARQRAYARARGDRHVYTPQVVVNGLIHVNGQDARAIDAGIRRTAQRLAKYRVPLKAWIEDNSLIIRAAAAPHPEKNLRGTIWLALVKRVARVGVERGENRGRLLTYYNLVRELTPVGEWNGAPFSLRLPKEHLMRLEADGCVVMVQKGSAGPIVAAVEIKHW